MGGFNSAFFDGLYPDEIGQNKARERLFVSAQIGCCDGLTKDEWKAKAKNDPELLYYCDLLGGVGILDHFAYTVWFMIHSQFTL